MVGKFCCGGVIFMVNFTTVNLKPQENSFHPYDFRLYYKLSEIMMKITHLKSVESDSNCNKLTPQKYIQPYITLKRAVTTKCYFKLHMSKNVCGAFNN